MKNVCYVSERTQLAGNRVFLHKDVLCRLIYWWFKNGFRTYFVVMPSRNVVRVFVYLEFWNYTVTEIGKSYKVCNIVGSIMFISYTVKALG